ncbi:MAG TPA: ferredoxin [Streptosporangiaceae bacterium]|jgi:ferredoxin
MALRLRVDPMACTGHGLCADLLAECIELDEWGFPIVCRDVPPGLAAEARRAVRACPALALHLGPGPGRQRRLAPGRQERPRKESA